MWLCAGSCTYVHGVSCTVGVEKGKMSTWLHDGWIRANRPKSTGREECLAMAMG